MQYDPKIHHRRSIRLKNYEYSLKGLYFITICTENRLCLFGEIVGAGSKPARVHYPNKSDQNRNPVPNRADLESAPTNINVGYGQIRLNDLGRIVEYTWFDLVNHIGNIKLHEFIVMPNHIHGIIEIIADIRAGLEPAPTGKMKPFSEIVRQLKTFSARRINQLRKMPGRPVWQRNYYEHIIRNEKSHHKLSEYIVNNPLNWQEDKYFEL